MYVASLELCKELYKLSGWQYGPPVIDGHLSEIVGFRYDIGYLLRMLPDITLTNNAPRHSGSWMAGEYGYYDSIGWIDHCVADTPEDAACKLAIELFKQGILTKNSTIFQVQ